jgi:hypothetical protein
MKNTFLAAFFVTLFLSGCTTVSATSKPVGENGEKSIFPGSDNPLGKSSVVIPEGAASESILSCKSKEVEYIPIPAVPAAGYTDIEIDPVLKKSKAVTKPWPTDPIKVNKLLTNISTNISQSSRKVSGGIGVGIFSASHSRQQYVVDFMKWRAEPLNTLNNKQLGWVRVGVGMRVVVDITKSDGSLSGTLLALAASAKAGKVEGSISTELIGIDAKEVTQAMPFTVDLSEGNIQKVIEALAIVKTKLYDDTTTVSPNLIAKIECASTQECKKDK